jgi:tetratricopeptide (TPR) repeat protein
VPEPYLRLAQLYLDKDRDFDAERLLVKGREATEEDARVRQMWEEVAMLRQSKRVAIARDEAQRDDNPSTRAAVTQAERERNRLEREVFSARIKREPNVAVHHYELGLRLQRAEKIREARDHFKAALSDPACRCGAALELGRCDELFGELPEALKHYRLAAESANTERMEQKKAALYAAAKLALRIKLAKLAERYLARLLRIDPNHREAILLMQCT